MLVYGNVDFVICDYDCINNIRDEGECEGIGEGDTIGHGWYGS